MLKSQAQEEVLQGIKALMNVRSGKNVYKKPAKCKLQTNDKDNIETEQKYYISSRTSYEHLMIVSGLTRLDLNDGMGYVINRLIHESEYYLQDNTFPFYHNNLTIDNDENKIQVEVNYNYAIPQILYVSCNKEYNHNNFKSQYSSKEFFLLIDLFTSLILNIISDDEFTYLLELLSRDTIINDFIKRLKNKVNSRMDSDSLTVITDYKNNKKITDKIYGYIGSPNLKNLLSTYINHKMTALLPYIEESIKNKTQFCQLKSVHDYRFIFSIAIGDKIQLADSVFESELKYNKPTEQLKIISRLLNISIPVINGSGSPCGSVIEPKYYIGHEAMDEVKHFALGLDGGNK